VRLILRGIECVGITFIIIAIGESRDLTRVKPQSEFSNCITHPKSSSYLKNHIALSVCCRAESQSLFCTSASKAFTISSPSLESRPIDLNSRV